MGILRKVLLLPTDSTVVAEIFVAAMLDVVTTPFPLVKLRFDAVRVMLPPMMRLDDVRDILPPITTLDPEYNAFPPICTLPAALTATPAPVFPFPPT